MDRTTPAPISHESEQEDISASTDSLMQQAHNFIERQQFSQALSALKSVIAYQNDHPLALLALADITDQQHKREESIEYLCIYLTFYPEDYDVRVRLAKAYTQHHDYDKSFQLYYSLLQDFPKKQELYPLITALTEKAPSPEHCEDILLQGLSYFPRDPNILYGLARIYRANKHFDSEMSCIEHAINTGGIVPDSTHVAYRELALSADLCGRHDHAFYYFNLSNHTYYINNKSESPDYHRFFDFSNQYKKHALSVDNSVDNHVNNHIDNPVNNHVNNTTDNIVDNFLSPLFIISFSPHDLPLPSRILSAHPELMVMQETNHIQEVINKALNMTGETNSYLNMLDKLTVEQCVVLRQYYYELVSRGNIQHLPDNVQLVDTSYSNFMYLEFIHYLFPETPIVSIERDPADAIFSAFTAKHVRSIFTLHCKTLTSSAQYYTAWQAMVETYFTQLDLEPLRINFPLYEQSIRNYTGRILHHINKSWQPSLLEQCKTIQEQPVLEHSSDTLQWKNYQYYVAEGLKEFG